MGGSSASWNLFTPDDHVLAPIDARLGGAPAVSLDAELGIPASIPPSSCRPRLDLLDDAEASGEPWVMSTP